jgi:hypothetical protein
MPTHNNNNNNNNSLTRRRHRRLARSNSHSSAFGMTWVGTTVPPRLVMSDNQVFTLMDSTLAVTFNQQPTLFSAGSISIQYASMIQNSALSGVFDQYRLDEVEITFRPGITVANTNTGNLPQLYTVVDYDDASTTGATTAGFFLQYNNCTQSVGETVVRRFKPHVATAYYATNATFTGFGNITSPWIDVASTLVPHYGVKFGCDGAPGTAYQTYLISTRIKASFRNVH